MQYRISGCSRVQFSAIFLLDHLKRVAQHAETNKMGRQQLAVCFAPLLLSPALSVAANEPAAYELRRQIDTLRWLLDLWPLPSAAGGGLREPLAILVRCAVPLAHSTHCTVR